MLGFQHISPPSDEGGGFLRKQKDGGREIRPHKTATFSLPQSRFARQLPRQRKPIHTPNLAKEPYKKQKHGRGAIRLPCFLKILNLLFLRHIPVVPYRLNIVVFFKHIDKLFHFSDGFLIVNRRHCLGDILNLG